jgi:hypothetical protein
MSNILESEYTEATRPFSQNELRANHDKLFRSFRIGTVEAHHRRCNHSYFVKNNGRKEKEIKENNNCDVGNCSVCWKIHKTPRQYRDKASCIVDNYMHEKENCKNKLHHFHAELEKVFYTWLYSEQE